VTWPARTAAAAPRTRRRPAAHQHGAGDDRVAAFTPYVGLPIDIRVEHFIVYALAIAAVASRSKWMTPPFDAASRRLLTVWLVATVIITFNTFVVPRRHRDAAAVLLHPVRPGQLPAAGRDFLALAVYGTRRDIDARDGLRASLQRHRDPAEPQLHPHPRVEPSQVQPILRLFWSNEANPYLFIDSGTVHLGRGTDPDREPLRRHLQPALRRWARLRGRTRRLVRALHPPRPRRRHPRDARGAVRRARPDRRRWPLDAVEGLHLRRAAGDLREPRPPADRHAHERRSDALLLFARPSPSLYVSRTWLPETSDRAFGLLSVYGEDDAVSTATGGRVSDFALYPEKLLNAMTPFGRGWGGIRDDAFIAFVEGAGPLGLLIYLAILVMLFHLAWRFPPLSVERRLALSLALLTSLSSLGAIPLQVNRGSSLLWLLLGLLYARARTQGRPRETLPVRRPTAAGDRAGDLRVAGGHHVRVEALRRCTPGADERLTQIRVEPGAVRRPRGSSHVKRVDEERPLAGDLDERRDAAREDGQADGLRLDHGHAEPFRRRDEREHVRLRVVLSEGLTREVDVGLGGRTAVLGVQHRTHILGHRPDDDQVDGQRRDGLREPVEVLVRRRPDGEHDRTFAPADRSAAAGRRAAGSG
jgi:hypothetical protein